MGLSESEAPKLNLVGNSTTQEPQENMDMYARWKKSRPYMPAGQQTGRELGASWVVGR